jgi:hypothetical protein
MTRRSTLFALAAVALAMALPALVIAAGRTYKGHVRGDASATVAFRLVHHGGLVKNFQVDNLPYTCTSDGGTQRTVGYESSAHMAVDGDGRFHGTGSGTSVVPGKRISGTVKIRVHGKIGRHGHASGRVRWTLRNSANFCDTGQLHWSANRVP